MICKTCGKKFLADENTDDVYPQCRECLQNGVAVDLAPSYDERRVKVHCRSCGAEIFEEAAVCPKCGFGTGYQKKYYGSSSDHPSGWLNLLAFLFPPIGIIIGCCIHGSEPNKANAVFKWSVISIAALLLIRLISYGVLLGAAS